ncbi:MAG: M28 family peptidase, partial [Pyrinomonadaceae bacterium]
DTPSPGLDKAARYIADHIKQWGLKPAGDNGTYFQSLKLKKTLFDQTKSTLTLRVGSDLKILKFGDDFLPIQRSGSANGKIVFVGHGWVVKSKGIDPYAGVDVKGKIMLVTQQTAARFPPGISSADLKRDGLGSDWMNPTEYARRNGAVGIIYIPDLQLLTEWPQRRERFAQTGPVALDSPVGQTPQPQPTATIPSAILSKEALSFLLKGEKVSLEELMDGMKSEKQFTSFDLSAEKSASLSFSTNQHPARTQNVIGILEGSDPVLRNEYVAFGAHYDHVGVGIPVNGDAIYNGADDDGSGTVGIMAIAEAFAKMPKNLRPKRSLLFVWHCGEEKGLWGSRFFTDHPTVPMNKIITQLNIDMIGRSKAPNDTTEADRELTGPDGIYVIGSKLLSTELGQLSERVNKSYLNLAFDYRYDDPNDPNRFFSRSDHFNYIRRGVPIIFYFSGVHADYHQPSDSVEKIDFIKMSKVARTVFMTGEELANASVRPKVDKTLPSSIRRTGR